MSNLNELAAWITSLGGLHPTIPVIPVEVRIVDETWQGVRYTNRRHYEVGMMACTHGNKTPKDTYDSENVLLLGERPRVNCKPSRRPNHCCYQLDGKDWYLAGYTAAETMRPGCPHDAKYSPFGPNFLIKPWDAPGTIDDHEFKWPKPRMPWSRMVHDPYIRYPLAITAL